MVYNLVWVLRPESDNQDTTRPAVDSITDARVWGSRTVQMSSSHAENGLIFYRGCPGFILSENCALQMLSQLLSI